MTILTLLLALSLLHFIHLRLHYKTGLKELTRITSKEAPSPYHSGISVIIPARNEERDIGLTIEHLQRQSFQPLEILVVNDHSQDLTSSIVQNIARKDPRVHLLHAPPLPSGWLGKQHASVFGTSHAKYNLLLFTDADVRFSPNAIASAVQEMNARRVDLLTLFPRTILNGFWESVIQPVILFILIFGVNISRINNPKHPESFGIGAFLLIRKQAYDRAGGFSSIRDQMIDDYAMAKIIKQSGGRIWLADGQDILSIRMYHSIFEIWTGWQKNLYAGLKLPLRIYLGKRQWVLWENQAMPTFLLVTLFLSLTFILPPLAFLSLIWSETTLVMSSLAFLAFLCFLGFGMTLYHKLGKSPLWAFFLPLGAILTLVITLGSFWQNKFMGGPVWRGRRCTPAK